tara:strand:+ start:108 stop:392 length:285 start_codon:yes stop_codon:yes gene_type:complete
MNEYKIIMSDFITKFKHTFLYIKMTINNYLPDLVKIALWVGTSATSAVMLIGVGKGKTRQIDLDWRDVAIWGTLGAIVGAQFGVTNKAWFGRRL